MLQVLNRLRHQVLRQYQQNLKRQYFLDYRQ
jgi:hypothetical protein